MAELLDDKTTLPEVSQEMHNQRIDRFVSSMLATLSEEKKLSRERVQELISSGNVYKLNPDGHKTPINKKNLKVQVGDVYMVFVPPPTPMDIQPENIPLDVLYEDASLIVVNKPPHMATHPAAGSRAGTLVHALLHHCKGSLSGIGGVERPGIVHRLDKGTSGVMVVAKTDLAHQSLAAQFKDRTVNRRYIALCRGVPSNNYGEIEGNIGRNPRDRKKMTILEKGGKPAKTSYWVTGVSEWGYAQLELKLYTGRTHQIRVHMSHAGYPLMGDPVYGKKQLNHNDMVKKGVPTMAIQAIKSLNHQMLHAYKLEFDHPISGDRHFFKSTLPADMEKLTKLMQIISIT